MAARGVTKDYYQMNHSPRGKAVLFNNMQRNTNKDDTDPKPHVQMLSSVLSDIGFDIKMLNNSSSSTVESLLKEEAQKDHRDADCFVCVILANREDSLQITKVLDLFKEDRCQSLAGKPKIFFVQANLPFEDALTFSLPSDMTDFLVVFSSLLGPANEPSGCKQAEELYFVKELTDVLRAKRENTDLLKMMVEVCRKVAADYESSASSVSRTCEKQMPCIAHSLTRDVYFRRKK